MANRAFSVPVCHECELLTGRADSWEDPRLSTATLDEELIAHTGCRDESARLALNLVPSLSC